MPSSLFTIKISPKILHVIKGINNSHNLKKYFIFIKLIYNLKHKIPKTQKINKKSKKTFSITIKQIKRIQILSNREN
jgi:hypothetical protein